VSIQSAPSENEGAFVLVREVARVQLISRKYHAKGRYVYILPMITYEKILEKPQAANSLIGMSLAEFEKLYAEFERAHLGRLSALSYTKRHGMKRKRAVGAGRKHKFALRDRLLMTLFWLRAYTTYKVLGTFYDLDKTTVEENLKNIMYTLSTLDSFGLERPQADVPRLRSVQEVIHAFPDVLLIIDVKVGE
jgi:DDE superfamily endonuclease